MSGTFLILTSAFLHALWNTLVKGAADPRVRLVPILVVASFISPLITFFFLTSSLGGRGGLGWVIGSGLCEAGYMICLGYTLQNGALGATYIIMRGGAMVVVWFISVLFLAEPLNFYSGGGLVLVLLGLALTQIQSMKTHQTASVSWALFAAVFIAGYHLCYGQALRFGIGSGVLFSLSLWISVPLLMLFSGKDVLHHSLIEMRNAPIKIIFGGLVCALSFIIFLQGLKSAGAVLSGS